MAKKKKKSKAVTSKVFPSSPTVRFEDGIIRDELDKIVGEYLPGTEGIIKRGIPMRSNPISPRPPLTDPLFQARPLPGAPGVPGGSPSSSASILEDFKRFMGGRPGGVNAFTAAGSALSGFAAPFLGQTYTPPQADTSAQDFQEFLLKEKIREAIKDPRRRQALELRLRGIADKEAFRLSGASAFGGLATEKQRTKYTTQRDAIFKQLSEQYGLTEGDAGGAITVDEDTYEIGEIGEDAEGNQRIWTGDGWGEF